MTFVRLQFPGVSSPLGLVTFLVLVGAPAELLAQDRAHPVRIVVHHHGDPVEGAEVQAGTQRAFTDEAGQAHLRLPAGEHELRIQRLGFARASLRIHVAPDDETVVRVELETEAIRGAELIVTSTRAHRRVQDEPLRVEILDREEIEEKMLMTPGDIAMLLNETGGLRVQVTSPSLGAANIRIQGMRGRYTQLLADGLPLYGGQAGAIGLLQIPPSDLGQVEVIKGTASALYGGSALGGVINLISRQPGDEAEGDLLLNATSHGGQDLTGFLSGPLAGEWGYSVLGGFHRQSRQDLDGSGWVDVPTYRRWTARPRLSWTDDQGQSLFLTLGAMTESRAGGTMPGALAPDDSPFPERLETDRLDGGANLRLRAGGDRTLHLRASGMVQDHGHTFGSVMEVDRHSTGFVEAALSGSAGPHTWVVGGALQRDGYRSENFPAFDYTFTVPAFFVQDEVRLSPEASLSASVRWDGHSAYGSQVSPRLSALLRPGPWTIRASAGGGFFAPTPFTEEIEAAGLARLQPPGDLKAERARNASVDVGRLWGPLEVNVVAFGSRIEDAVQLVPLSAVIEDDPPRAAQVGLRNVEGTTRTTGGELLARLRWSPELSLTASYLYVQATEPVPLGEGRRDVPLTPRHTAGLVGMWEDHDRGLLGIEAYFTGRQPLDDNPYRAEGHSHVHLGVLGEFRRGPFSVFLNAENLLNVRQSRIHPLQRAGRAPDGRWTVDAWAPLEGFVVNGGFRLRLGGGDHDDEHH
jgi:outer membrane receptor for ferrienterochelin and colicins